MRRTSDNDLIETGFNNKNRSALWWLCGLGIGLGGEFVVVVSPKDSRDRIGDF